MRFSSFAFRRVLIATAVVVLWTAPKSFAQWTCSPNSNCTSPAQIYTPATVGVGVTGV